MEIMTLERWN